MPIRLGSRVFRPRWFTTAATLIVLALLVSLGRWQLDRADQKRAVFDAFARSSPSTAAGAAGSGESAVIALDATTTPLPRYQRVVAHGHYVSDRQFLIDNRIAADGRVGYEVITPFELGSGAWMLVNRGWIPVGDSRQQLPVIEVPGTLREIHGRVDHLPQPGLKMGTPAPLAAPFPIRAAYPSIADIRAVLGPHRWVDSADVVLLDADQADGYRRDWAPPGFPPMRHIAYAVQWFGLALTLIVIYFVTNLTHEPR